MLQNAKTILIISLLILAGCNLPSNMVDQFRKQKNPEAECQEMQKKGQFPKGHEYYIKPNGDVYSSNPVIGCYYQGTLDKEIEMDTGAYGKAKFLYKLEGGYLIRYVRTVGETNVIREIQSDKQIKKIYLEQGLLNKLLNLKR